MLQEVMHAVSGHHGDQYGRRPQDLPFVSTTLGTGDPFRCSIATDRATSTGSGSSLRACADISPRHEIHTAGDFRISFPHPCTSSKGKVSLCQTRGADMPDAANPFASRLARTRIP